ncbi:MAG TPA: phosphoribosylformylglycinamidine cyclo-ligase [Burkholderiales bacterium]|nr:phosphoribosylformylglycinamidine cyclo-ligase [Burkholderiales bacterium]
MPIGRPLTYAQAGVDIAAGDRLVERIKPLAARTRRAGVIAGIGGFGALFEIPKNYRDPVLVAGTDGVGTKLKLAFQLNKHDTVGIDLVAMNANDILTQGAEPLFFLDYFACSRLKVEVAEQVIAGIAAGCEQAGCALIGGETAEMPGMYAEGEYDLAGFAVGAVERSRIIDGRRIEPGDILLGLASSGAHSNGYSLIRKIIEAADLSSDFGGCSLGEVLLAPTRIYVKPVLDLIANVDVKGLAHITGGGLIENIPRILPENVAAVLDPESWPRPAVFDWLQREGNLANAEMRRVFNCGIGMVLVAAPQNAGYARERLEGSGETVWQIGRIEPRQAGQPQTVVL